MGSPLTRLFGKAPPSAFATLVAMVWAVVVAVGMGLLVRYSLGPGRPAHAPELWPAGTRAARTPGRPSLVMIAHPRCACTRASLGELAVLMARCPGRLSATVLFVRPQGTPVAWDRTDLRSSAEAIPGVAVITDDDGREARRFGAATSGQVLLYDTEGRLEFSGGITAGRGHSGDNAGRAALEARLLEGRGGRPTTPVFGCALFDSRSAPAESAAGCRP